jgi:hypothetical protein
MLGGAVGRRRGRRLVRSLPRTAWLVRRGSEVAGCLGGSGPPGRAGRGGRPTQRLRGLVARVCRLYGGFLVPAALRRGSGGLSAGAEGVGPRLGAVTAWACTAGERGVAGNVGRTGRAHGDPDGTGDDRRQRRDRRAGARESRRYRRWRRACRPHPSPRTQPLPLRRQDASRRPRRRRPTTPARHQDSRRRRGTTATSHEPARRSGIVTLPSYIDGNVTQDVRAGDACDVTVVAGTTGHAPLRPYQPLPLRRPRREPTATAPPTNHARATPDNPPADTRIPTSTMPTPARRGSGGRPVRPAARGTARHDGVRGRDPR